jgi:queuine tRNA-ribosyltransferase
MATRCSSFEVVASDGQARRGRLTLPHGDVQTPAFMPVGTYGAVRCVDPQDIADSGSDILLSNTFHLVCNPGAERVKALGGLHRWMAWDRPILTDSGGFQVFSLRHKRTIDDHGVRFANPRDGAMVELTPESALQAQIDLGVDIAMQLDECPALPGKREDIARAMRRSLAWAKRSLAVPRDPVRGPALFGIVQGGLDEALRQESIDGLVALDLDGYAIGGLSVGESSQDLYALVRFAAPRLPGGRPRYLMGVGYPEDIVEAVAAGVDLFDCVLPTRNARNGNLFTSRGRLVIKHARWADDDRPLDEDCGCSTCRRFSRAYLRHLYRNDDSQAARLMSIHNLSYYQGLMARIRAAITAGTLDELLQWARSREDGEPPSRRRVE